MMKNSLSNLHSPDNSRSASQFEHKFDKTIIQIQRNVVAVLVVSTIEQ